MEKLEWRGYPMLIIFLMICLFVLTQLTNVTDRQTDTAWRHRPRLHSIARQKLRLRYCTIEANYWQTRNIARPLCDSRATCKMLLYGVYPILSWYKDRACRLSLCTTYIPMYRERKPPPRPQYSSIFIFIHHWVIIARNNKNITKQSKKRSATSKKM